MECFDKCQYKSALCSWVLASVKMCHLVYNFFRADMRKYIAISICTVFGFVVGGLPCHVSRFHLRLWQYLVLVTKSNFIHFFTLVLICTDICCILSQVQLYSLFFCYIILHLSRHCTFCWSTYHFLNTLVRFTYPLTEVFRSRFCLWNGKLAFEARI